MISYSQDRKKRTHAKIVKSASRLFRKHGYKNSGVDKVMKSAGLTVGGFYAHFPSKDALLAEAIANTMKSGRRLAYEAGMDGLAPLEWMREVMERLLSETQRKDMENGCPLAALMNEVARCPASVKKQYQEEVLKNLDVMFKRCPGSNEGSKRKNALFFLTVLMGAISFARALPSDELANEVLEVAKESILKLAHSEEERLRGTR